MQKILFFHTILSGINILLLENNIILDERNIISHKQSEILVSSLNNVLKDHNLDYKDIDIFASITGPGNFTSIKTSLAVLKGLQIATNKPIITTDMFEIISHNKNNYDTIILDIGTQKYYIKENNNYYTIFKKEIDNLLQNKNLHILTNDHQLLSQNIQYTAFSNENIINIINKKIKNKEYSNEIIPLYIEEAKITKRK